MRRPGAASTAHLRRLFAPRHIAVFGGRAAAEVVRQCRALGFAGEIWPVHPSKETLEGFYPKLGDALKARFAGWTCYLFSADMALQKKIGLSASKRTPLFNGALECRLFEYKVVAGFNRKTKPTD